MTLSKRQVIKGIQDKTIDINNFSQHHLHPKSTDEHALNLIFLIDTLNFCFWTPPGQPKWNVDNETGYFALCAAVNRAMREGYDITNPAFYSTITLADLEKILRADDGQTHCPLLEERVKCLHEVGKTLLEKYGGKFENCIKKSNHSAKALLRLIVDEFPCFRDEGDFAGKRVAIYKRAQILVGDVWACYRGEGLGHFDDIIDVTMFADYRVPQVLVHFGALKYSNELMDKLQSGKA
jgi:Potential Queuosine, Q, salvage protein family